MKSCLNTAVDGQVDMVVASSAGSAASSTMPRMRPGLEALRVVVEYGRCGAGGVAGGASVLELLSLPTQTCGLTAAGTCSGNSSAGAWGGWQLARQLAERS